MAVLIHYSWGLLWSLTPRLATGRFGRDSLSFLLTLAWQVAVLPTLPGVWPFDLMTPWIVHGCVTLGPVMGFFWVLLGSLALEAHGAVPVGYYGCVYIVIWTLIHMFKQHISWRYPLAWVTIFLAAQIWVEAFWGLVSLFKTGWVWDMSALAASLMRLLMVGVAAIGLCRWAWGALMEESSP